MPGFKDALEAKSTVASRVLGQDNFTGLGIGMKHGSFCLRIYVRRKLPRLPTFLKYLIDDFPVNVIETGELYATGGPPGSPAKLQIGANVKLAGAISQGRVGGFVAADGELHLLSCGHVLDGRGLLGQAVFSGGRVVGHLSGQDILQPECVADNRHEDCARAKLAAGVNPSFDLPEPLGGLSSPIPAPAEAGMIVWKAAHETASGVIADCSADMRVHYSSVIAVLRNQLLVHKPGGHFSRPGDSGAMVVATRGSTCEAVGIVVGSSHATPEWSVVTPMERVLKSLGSELVIR